MEKQRMINWDRINMFLFNGFIFIAIVGGLYSIAYFDSKCKEEKRIKDQAEYNRQFSGCRNINIVFNRETGKLEYEKGFYGYEFTRDSLRKKRVFKLSMPVLRR